MKGIIFAIGIDSSFGNKGGLPWDSHDKDDMAHFRCITKKYKNIVMASNTYHSLPSLLPKRNHFVITSKEKPDEPNDVVFINPYSENFEVVDKILGDTDVDEYLVIGGKKLIESALNSSIDFTVYLTIIEGLYEADVRINLSLLNRNGYVVKSKDRYDNCTIYKIERR